MHLARAVAVSAALAVAASTLATAATADPDPRSRYTFAVIGDVPYGADQIAAFPGWIQQINADPDVRSVVHLGDIKNGSRVCSDAYFDLIRSDFDTFEDPLVYTPGDNEWTDCHRANNGAYNPLERLAVVRSLFFPVAGETLRRHPKRVDSEPALIENVRWVEARVAFATLHVIGSNNGLN